MLLRPSHAGARFRVGQLAHSLADAVTYTLLQSIRPDRVRPRHPLRNRPVARTRRAALRGRGPRAPRVRAGHPDGGHLHGRLARRRRPDPARRHAGAASRSAGRRSAAASQRHRAAARRHVSAGRSRRNGRRRLRSRSHGQVRPLVVDVDGIELPPTNFVFEDDRDRVWITVSTRRVPRAAAYRADVADGFIVLVDRARRAHRRGRPRLHERGDRLADGAWLYVNETFARRLSRFPLRADGVSDWKEVVTTFGHGTYPDGLGVRCRRGVWITSIVSNRLIRVARTAARRPCSRTRPGALEWGESAYLAGTMGRPHLDRRGWAGLPQHLQPRVRRPGPAHRRISAACSATRSPVRVPVAGAPPVHWHFCVMPRHAQAAAAAATATAGNAATRRGRGATVIALPGRASRTDDAYRSLRRRILDNVYPPGHQALESALAPRLSASAAHRCAKR